MSFSKPKVPSVEIPETPAVKPERQVDVEAGDVQLGDEESQSSSKRRGKRSLMRPTGTMGGTASGGGTGLAV